MKPPPFKYVAPETTEEVLAALSEYGTDAKLLAGGQSLVPMMNFRVVQPEVLIDLNRVTNLDYIQENAAGGLTIGAMTRHRALESAEQVRVLAPLMHEAMPLIAHSQIRNRGTLGGSLAHADPAAELPVVARALDARIRLRSLAHERWVSAEDFFLGFFTTELAHDELLVELEIPPPEPLTGTAFIEFARRKGDYAIVGVAAWIAMDTDGACQSARLVYLNAGDVPMVASRAAAALSGAALTGEAIDEAVEIAAMEEIEPMGSIHSSVDYQRHLARILGRKALELASGRARAGLVA